MDWIVTTARSVDEARTRALDLLGVDLDDAEIQVLEEGKTGLFGRTKTEARVRARIKPKAPPVKEERRNNRNDKGGNRNRNRGGRNKGGNNKGGNNGGGNRNKGGNTKGGGSSKSSKSDQNANKGGGDKAAAAAGGGAAAASSASNDGGNKGRGRNRRRGGGAGGGNSRNDGRNGGGRSNEDRVEMPIEEQRETLEAFVTGVATAFDPSAQVTLVEEGTTLQAQVRGDDLGRLIGAKASTLQTLEELARTAMHRAAEGRRYHRIQVDVDEYRERRRVALTRFATDLAEQVAESGTSKALEPMGAADRKLVHDAVADVAGVETVSEGRDPRRYIVIIPTEDNAAASLDEEE